MGLQDTLINTGMGLLLEGHNDRRQLRQQGKLNEQQYDIDNRMAEANYERQMRMWNATNYSAQMQQLGDAGLNPALMYKGQGAGGITGNPQGSVSGAAKAPAGGMEIMNMMATRAQIDLIKAQTEKTKAETGNVPLTGKNIEATTASIYQGIENQKAVQRLTELQADIASVASEVQGKTQNAQIARYLYELEQSREVLGSLESRNRIDRAEADKIQERIKLQLANIAADTWLKGQQGQQANAQAKAAVNSIQMAIQENMRQWDKLSIESGESNQRLLDEMSKSDFPQELTEILKALGFGAILKGSAPATPPIRGFHKRD